MPTYRVWTTYGAEHDVAALSDELRSLWPKAVARLERSIAGSVPYSGDEIETLAPGVRVSRYVHEDALQVDFYFLEQEQLVWIISVDAWVDPGTDLDT